MVHMLGGPADFVEKPDRLSGEGADRKAGPGDTRAAGFQPAMRATSASAVIDLGGGRRHPADKIDHRVGFSALLPLGTRVEKGDPIAIVHAADEAAAERAAGCTCRATTASPATSRT